MRSITLFLSLAYALWASPALAVEVKLQVQETARVGRSPAAITTGVPFAHGAVADVGKLSVAIGGKAVPAQFTKLAPWDDGSARWALMDVQAAVPAGGKVELVVSDSSGNAAPANPVQVQDGPDAITVSTGPLQFAVSKKKFNLFQSLKVDGRELLTAAGKGLVVVMPDGGEVLAGEGSPPTEVKVEQAGPLRAIVCVRGKFPGIHNNLLGYTVRISAFAGCKHVKVHVWLENHGGFGYFTPKDFNHRENEVPPNIEWFPFKGMAVDLGLGLGDGIAAACEGAAMNQPGQPSSFKVLQVCQHSKTKKIRDSVGPFYTWTDFEYVITDGGRELKRGDRTDGVVALKGDGGAMTVAIRDFWQNYEKAIQVDGGKGKETLRLWLWPTEGQWPRPYYWFRYGIDPLVQKATPEKMYTLQGGTHKGHEFILDFSGRDPKESHAELAEPLMALASADYYASTEAVPALFAPPEVRTADRDGNAKLDAWVRMTRSAADPVNPSSLWQARQVMSYSGAGSPDSTHWFGWMDYGDLCIPGHGPVSLHYDWTWIMLLDAIRTSDMGFIRLGSSMARHHIDIDQLWSDRDLPEYNGLVRPNGGWPGYHCMSLFHPPSPADNWLPGVVFYYLLTGEPKALECCMRNAAGLRTAWAWLAQNKVYWNPQGDMLANAQSMSAYCAMYRLTGERKWLDDALALFNGRVVPVWKSLGPFLHDPANQIRGQDYMQEDMKYCYSVAMFCELHHLTGDATVFKMLREGCEKTFPESFFDAPLFLADLYAYVGLKLSKVEYLNRAADSLAQTFPESKCPPVFLPDNSTWSRTSAMMLRTGHLLQYAYWKLRS